MNNEIAIMLENLFNQLNEKFKDKKEAWDKLIEFIAIDNHAKWFFEVDHKFECSGRIRGL